ncbi:AzlD domain-containing protein [Calidifontibacter sp. DB0510]|uniref:AzlD domain-containing protein n=1 Tax=Metallococcus carri TaxID=1656884 RepID=A0A967EAI6_9MICO|nr:AzlD domain-containing protein [Metallococcus carri]NHN55924.1 AzlD domain-containing protein [Metallococcus carri]NOP38388.1 AzlD domain-containing protein [Calidifontibacter sp. DB2511S]
MNTWTVVLLAGAISIATKLLGYLVPQRWLSGRVISQVMHYLPVALLGALVAVQTFGSGSHGPAIDARSAGLLVAIVALVCRAPFLLVIVLAALTAALLRQAGLG